MYIYIYYAYHCTTFLQIPKPMASCQRLPSPCTGSGAPMTPHAPPAKRSLSQWAAPSTAARDATYNKSQPQARKAVRFSWLRL